MASQRVCITGAGMVSPLGSDPEEIWSRLQAERPWSDSVDTARFAPYAYHPEAPFDASTQIPVRTQVRSMGRSQLNATYAAGAALQAAGLKGAPGLLARVELLVACGAGDNDVESDVAMIDEAITRAQESDAFLNERMMSLRPSLYLNQLPNLFAANISIAQGVLGSSVTFIGDEVAGMNAVHAAFRRIEAGQAEVMLVGGASEGGRMHWLEPFAAREELVQGEPVEIWDRRDDRTCFGNGAAFLVLESVDHARARGAEIKCFVAGVELSYGARAKSPSAVQTGALLARMRGPARGVAQVLTCSNLERGQLAQEEAFWASHASDYQNLCNVVGGMLEASFPLSMALSVLCLQRGVLLPAVSTRHRTRARKAAAGPLAVACWGRSRGEAVALLEARP